MDSNPEISYTVNEAGFLFELCEDGVRVAPERWTELDPGASPALAMVLQLLDEDNAFIDEGRVLLSHSVAVAMSNEDKRTLMFPEPYPFIVDLKAHGSLTDNDFRYMYRFLGGSGQPFVNPQRTGSDLRISEDQVYMLPAGLYHLLRVVDQYNVSPAEGRSQPSDLLNFAEIKGLAQDAGVLLDTYLTQSNVIIPDCLSVRLRQTEDELEVEPVLSRRQKKSKNILDVEDASVAEPAPVEPLLDEAGDTAFMRRFDGFSRTRNIYPIGDGVRVVLDDHQKEALGEFKQVRRLSGKEKDLFLESPQAFLDPEVVYLEDFSERVQEIGVYKPEAYPFLRPQKEPWLPPEGGILIDGTQVIIPQENAASLKHRLDDAMTKGQKDVLWQGQAIPATPETVAAVERLIESDYDVPRIEDPNRQNKEQETEKGHDKRILIIKDNFESSEYQAQTRVRPGEPGLPRSLREDINPFPHQEEGIRWLQDLWIQGANGALLADDMGLGKTFQALAFMAWCRELMDAGEIPVRPMLIVAPVVLLTNWAEEYKRFLELIFGHDMLMLHGNTIKEYKHDDISDKLGIRKETEIKDRDEIDLIMAHGRGLLLRVDDIARHGAVLTTYETIRDYQFSLGRIGWSVMVIDEAQKVKTPTAMVTLAVKAMNYEFGLGMTGTPVENSWVDLWSLMDFVQPGHLGSRKEFAARYYHPLQKEGTDIEELGRSLFENIDGLLKRRMKEDYLVGLPKKTPKLYKTTMPKVQLDRYLQVVEQARGAQKGGEGRNHIFRTLATLRDVSLCPFLPYYDDNGLFDMADDDIIGSSARLTKTIEILDIIRERSEKAIIFLISKKMQRVLRPIIHHRYGIYPYIINGDIPGGRRKTHIDAFQDTQGFNVIIISTDAGGVGLNITEANHVIHLSRVWNPAKEDQATDRVYRIGQQRDVEVHIPLAIHPVFDNEVCRGAFDEKLHRLLEDKRRLSRSVLYPGTVSESDLGRMGDEILGFAEETEDPDTIQVEDVDRLSPLSFEALLLAIHRNMGRQVEKTPEIHDDGADVVVLPKNPGECGMLIQCKHTTTPEKVQGTGGVHEIVNARGVYEREYGVMFDLMVATNAERFGPHAQQLADVNEVSLVSRMQLSKLLNEHPITIGDLT